MSHPAASRLIRTVVAVAAIVAGVGTLWGVTTLFQSRGTPLEQLAAAERACAERVYVSEKQACINRWIADSNRTSVAAR